MGNQDVKHTHNA